MSLGMNVLFFVALFALSTIVIAGYIYSKNNSTKNEYANRYDQTHKSFELIEKDKHKEKEK